MAVKYKVVITPLAQEQVHKIVQFWDGQDEYDRATAVLEQILVAIDSLADMPSRHSPVPSISTQGILYRRILSKPYRIIFEINEREMTVSVVDVDHEKRDPQILIDKFGG